jgi:nucleoside-diphosphate-sugar epimerase
MRRILILGGGGFIGLELAKKHLQMGDKVVVFDNCSNSMDFECEKLFGRPNIIFVKGDVVNLSQYTMNNIDVIYHLASESRPTMFEDHYRQIVDANVVGIRECLKVCSPNTKIIFASTSEVYGHNNSELTEDSDCVITPYHRRNIYSLAKLMAENILQNELNYDWNIVRFFNVYGPVFRLDEDKVIPNILRSVMDRDNTGEPFTIYGDGSQVRSFTHIDDIVNGLSMLSLSDLNHEIINLGRNEPISINDLVGQHFPGLKVEYKPGRLGEPHTRIPSVEKARELLRWKAVIPLEQGIVDVINKCNNIHKD